MSSRRPAIVLFELNDHPAYLSAVVGWTLREWPKPARSEADVERRLCGDRRPMAWPAAIVAVREGAPVGFVSLVFHEPSAKLGRPHWIDALYVVPELRGEGIARELLRAAEGKAVVLGAAKLHALTEIPRLYEKSGWTILEASPSSGPDDVIVHKALGPTKP